MICQPTTDLPTVKIALTSEYFRGKYVINIGLFRSLWQASPSAYNLLSFAKSEELCPCHINKWVIRKILHAVCGGNAYPSVCGTGSQLKRFDRLLLKVAGQFQLSDK